MGNSADTSHTGTERDFSGMMEKWLAESLQTVSRDVLLALAKGEIDVGLLARRELASRGLGRFGEWVGFDKAGEEWGLG